MFSQRTSNTEDAQILYNQEFADLYKQLGIETEEQRKNAVHRFDQRQNYWPPIPEYSVRFCTDEDLNY
jgi:hypothetical protein